MHLVGTEKPHSQRRVWLAYVALVLMNTIDLVYTHLIYTTQRMEPIIGNLFHQQFGTLGIVVVKLLFLVLLGLIIRDQYSHKFYRNSFYIFVVAYGLMTSYHTCWFFGFLG